MEAPARQIAEPDPRLDAPAAGPCAQDIQKVLAKVLASRTFQSAEGQRKFLRYVVEEKLAGRGDQIKEYSVGIEVFGREESFDPRSSSIVRSEARKLRARLAKYYESEGGRDEIRIEFPKGGYVPIFQATAFAIPGEAPAVEAAPAVEPEPSTGPAEAGVPSAPNSASLAGPLPWLRKYRVPLFVILAVAAAGAFLAVRTRASRNLAARPASIVVLPFLDLSEEKDDSFTDGLTEELIASLTRVPGLHVVASTSSFQYKNKKADIRKIGQELNVKTALAGSVRRSGHRLRIVAQLNDATNGYNLWSETYDRNVQDALQIQREISSAIVGSLRPQFAGNAAAEKLADGAPVNPEAYIEYLQGLYFRNRPTGDNIKAAIGHFQKAIEQDPHYAAAYAELAKGYAGLPVFTATLPRDVDANIRSTAEKAISLDPNQSEAHLALAWQRVYEYDWRGAEEEFQKAIEISPGSVDVHREYAHYLQRVGRLDEALSENQKALVLDPISPLAIQGIARSLYFLRRYDEAIEQYRRALALDPNYGVARQALGLAFILKKSYPEALAESQTAHQLIGDSFTTAQLGYIYAVSGNSEGARRILADFLKESQNHPFPALAVAHVYMGLGDKAHAIEWLRKAVEQHDVNVNLKVDPMYDPLRPEPGFAQLLELSRLN